MRTIAGCSLRSLFLVSILHSSQRTSESLLLGSECVEKHFLQMECPHNSVNGSYKYSKQLKHESVESKSATFLEFLSNIVPTLILI